MIRPKIGDYRSELRCLAGVARREYEAASDAVVGNGGLGISLAASAFPSLIFPQTRQVGAGQPDFRDAKFA